VLAEVNLSGTLLLLLGALFVGVSALTIYLRSRTTGQPIEIPKAMVPGPADAALETPLLHKLQGWGLALFAFFVVWFPITWLFEPSTNLKQDKELLAQSIERGKASVLLYSEENQLGVGCVRCHGPELRGGVIASGATFAYPANLSTICAGNLGDHPNIVSVDDIYQVIREGRGAMPSWSIRFQGALDDQQVQDLVNYLIDYSSKNVPFENNICLNPDAATRAEEKAIANGTVVERP
jgi:mono/diheme cytochrome c family protein